MFGLDALDADVEVAKAQAEEEHNTDMVRNCIPTQHRRHKSATKRRTMTQGKGERRGSEVPAVEVRGDLDGRRSRETTRKALMKL